MFRQPRKLLPRLGQALRVRAAFFHFPHLRDLRVLLCKFFLYLEQTAGFFD